MNYNKSQKPNKSRVVLVLCISVAVVIAIIYMKHSSADQKQLVAPRVSTSNQPVAMPDTTIDPSIMPASPETVQVTQLPDTILGKDTRNPYEAGYDDGYAAGCDDGALNSDNESYDDSNTFSSTADKQNYSRGYKEGYEQGLEDGKQGKQFNI